MKLLLTTLLALTAGAGCAAGPREMPVVRPPEKSPSAPGFPETGAWTSVSLKGPGSAAWRSVDLILHDDGRCVFVGEGEAEVQAFCGRFTSSDGRLTIVRADGRTVRFEWRKEGPMLVLTEGTSELRMKPIGT